MMTRHSCRAAPSGAGSVFRPPSVRCHRRGVHPQLPFAPFAVLLLAGTFGASCTAPPPVVELEYSPIPEERLAELPAGVESAHPEITVRRAFVTSGPCRTLEADLVRPDPNQLVLRISAMRGDPDCEDRSRTFEYSAVVRDLRPGRYNLRVVHSTFDNGRRKFETVLDHAVQVTP